MYKVEMPFTTFKTKNCTIYRVYSGPKAIQPWIYKFANSQEEKNE